MATTRFELAQTQHWLCAWCGGRMQARFGPDQATCEHLVPRSHGGDDRPDNLVAACRACNQARADVLDARTFLRWRRPLAASGLWPACTAPTPKMAKALRRLAHRLHRTPPAAKPRQSLNRLRAAWAREEREGAWV